MDWSGDYSMLLHSIEDNIENINGIKSLDNLNIRKRNRESTASSVDATDLTPNKYNSANIRLSLQLDESKLLNEELTDKLNYQKDEFERERDRYARQLQFMEAENSKLKTEVTDKSEKYYAIKKKMQLAIRTFELEKEELNKKQSRKSHSSDTNKGNDNSLWIERFQNLEYGVNQKNEECKRLSQRNLELEEKCGILEQQLVMAKANTRSSDDLLSNAHINPKRYADMELSLKQKTHEIEKLKSQLKNQLLQKEESDRHVRKISRLELECSSKAELQLSYNNLLQEREAWNHMFADVIKSEPSQGDEGAGLGRTSVNVPATVLRMLSELQSKYASLVTSASNLEASVKHARQQLRACEERASKAEKERAHVDQLLHNAHVRAKGQQQQSSIYEGEIKSLRALLSSYNTELSLGKSHSSSEDLNKRLVQDLRQELDVSRSASKSCMQEIDNLRSQLEAASKPTVDLTTKLENVVDEKRRLQRSYDMLYAQLTGLQHSVGVDYIPSQTRVLHMTHNPTFDRIQHRPHTVGDTNHQSLKKIQPATKSSSHPTTDSNTSIIRDENASLAVSQSSNNNNSGIDSSKMNQRLKEMFKERITSFREGIYLLTGYRVDLITPEASQESGSVAHPQLRLKSMYAEDPSDSLIFQWRDGALELLETPFAAKLDLDLMRYLTSTNSVPAFTSAVTLDLFERQTYMG